MSKFIHEYENSQLLNQIRYVILSNVNDDYPYYRCYISNATYNNFVCCFNKELTFRSNGFTGSTDNIYIRGYVSNTTTGAVTYTKPKAQSICESGSYSQNNQDLEFTNVANNQNGLIDLIADTKFYSSSSLESTTISDETTSLDLSSITPYLFLISAILMLIFITNFIKSCFKRRS